MSRITSDILTLDNLLHIILGLAVMALSVLYLPLGATAALYLREQGQARSWSLNWSFHKHAEWVVPSAVLALLFPLIQ